MFVGFIGGPLYSANDPCSEDYVGWAHLAVDRLEVGAWTVPHPERPPIVDQPGQPIIACPAVGYPYLFELRLPAPFVGSDIRDMHSGALWIAPANRVADLARLPDGYRLTSLTVEPTIHELAREYRAQAGEVGGDDRYLYLTQVFDGPSNHRIDAAGTVSIHEIDLPFGTNGAGFIVSWPLGRDTLTLITDDAEITLERFAAMANAVAIRGP